MTTKSKIKIGIVGGAGYTGGELLRILIHHSNVDIVFVNSKSNAGKYVHHVHNDLLGDTDLIFTEENEGQAKQIDCVFLCSGHGESKKFLEANPVYKSIKIIDLSADYRTENEGFIYGLPELQRGKIKDANYIANPGCFATSIELALLPLANEGLIKDEIHVSAVTGSTGAGHSLSNTTHFSWRNNNMSIYKAFNHQHLVEIGMVLDKAGGKNKVNFIPYRGNFTRGIIANIYTKFEGNIEEANKIYKQYYALHPFTHVSDTENDVKQVVNTNKCILHLTINDGNLLITSVIDNLTKGAAGQAVQNMNLMFGIDEKTGLNLKSVGF